MLEESHTPRLYDGIADARPLSACTRLKCDCAAYGRRLGQILQSNQKVPRPTRYNESRDWARYIENHYPRKDRRPRASKMPVNTKREIRALIGKRTSHPRRSCIS